MPTFRVMLSGTNVFLKTSTGYELHGFVRNEYVWANTETDAISKASQRARAKLARKEGVLLREDTPLELTVDEVQSDSLWKLITNESFIFFELKPTRE